MKIGIIYNQAFQLTSIFQQVLNPDAAAVGFLALNLTKLGHEVTIFSQQTNNHGLYDVRCRGISIIDKTLHLDRAMLEANFDLFILKDDAPELLIQIKRALPYQPKIYLWTALSADAKQNKSLSSNEIVNALQGILCISTWHKQSLVDHFHIPSDKINVLRYAISPEFEQLFLDPTELTTVKSKTPLFAYTTPPLDGLETLLDLLPDVAQNYPSTHLNVFCDLLTTDNNTATYETLFKRINKLPSTTYCGGLSNIKIAALLRNHTIFAYPNLNPHCSEVAILEAMAAGLYVVSVNVGSTYEYMLGRGKCVDASDVTAVSLNSFTSQLLSICQIQTHSAEAFYDYAYKQVLEVNQQHTWGARARQLIEYVNNWE